MKNLDKLAALVAKGGLTVKAFVKICFPESREKTLGAVGAMLKRWNAEIRGGDDIEAKYPAEYAERMLALMEETGCTVEEALVVAQGGKQPPIPRYFATGTLQLEAFDGTTRGARSQLAADMDRPANYSIVGGQQNILGEDRGFLCSFPRRRPPRAGVVRDHDALAGGPRQPARRTRRIRHRLERARPR